MEYCICKNDILSEHGIERGWIFKVKEIKEDVVDLVDELMYHEFENLPIKHFKEISEEQYDAIVELGSEGEDCSSLAESYIMDEAK